MGTLVRVRTNDEDLCEILVNGDETFQRLKEKLQEETGISPERQSIYCLGYHISDDTAKVVELLDIARKYQSEDPYFLVFPSAIPWTDDSKESDLDTTREAFIVFEGDPNLELVERDNVTRINLKSKKLSLMYPLRCEDFVVSRKYTAHFYALEEDGIARFRIDEDENYRKRLWIIKSYGKEELKAPKDSLEYTENHSGKQCPVSERFTKFCSTFLRQVIAHENGNVSTEQEQETLVAHLENLDISEQPLDKEKSETILQSDEKTRTSQAVTKISESPPQVLEYTGDVKAAFTPGYTTRETALLPTDGQFQDGMAAFECDSQDQTKLDSEFIAAASRGHFTNVQTLLEKGANVNAKGKSGKTALHLAIQEGLSDVVKVLLNQPTIDVKAVDENSNTALHQEAGRGHLDLVKQLIEKGADVNAKGKKAMTPLRFAIENGCIDVAKYLLTETEADVEAKDINNDTALHYAARSGNLALVQLLLSRGACVNTKGRFEKTPLHVASENGHTETVKIFLSQSEVNIDSKDKDDNTVLHHAAKHGHHDLVQLLISRGADANAKTLTKQTPLLLASENNHHNVVRLLLTQSAADVNATDEFKNTAFHHIAQHGHVDLTEMLISKGAGANAKGKYEMTPLHWASNMGHEGVVRLILDNGAAEVDVTDSNNETPLHLAAQQGHLHIAQLLIEYGADVNAEGQLRRTPLHLASHKGHTQVVQFLLNKAKVNVNSKDRNRDTALHFVARNGSLDLAQLLIKRGADINVKGMLQRTPLHWASENGHIDMVIMLALSGAEITVTDEDKRIPLHLSCFEGHLPVVQYLVEECKAEVNAKDKYIETPLHKACIGGHLSVVQYLVEEANAEVNATDNHNETPLHKACWRAQALVAEYLIKEAQADITIADVKGRTARQVVGMGRIGSDGSVEAILTCFMRAENRLRQRN